MGLDAKVWGSPTWFIIFYTIQRAYDKEITKDQLLSFLQTQVRHLVCKDCSEHTFKEMDRLGIWDRDLDDINHFFRKLYNSSHGKNKQIDV